MTKQEAQELNAALAKQLELQDKLLAAQEEIIKLQKQLLLATPTKPDEDVHWNQVSDGKLAESVFASNDITLVKQFYEWLLSFGEKYLRPYVHSETYAEVIAHMSRGLADKLAELETLADIAAFSAAQAETPKTQLSKKTEGKAKRKNESQLSLLPSDKKDD